MTKFSVYSPTPITPIRVKARLKAPLCALLFAPCLWSLCSSALAQTNQTPIAATTIGPKTAVQTATVVRLDEFTEGEHDWHTWMDNNVKEKAAVVNEAPATGGQSLKLSADFSGGGRYAAIDKNLADFGLKDIAAVRFQAKTDSLEKFSVRFTDGTGQTHQKKGIAIPPDGQWHEIVITPASVAGIEHWGGANDGVWHGEPQSFVVLISNGVGPKANTPDLTLSNIRADAVVGAVAQPAAFSSTFEDMAALAPNWTSAGNVKIDASNGFKGKNSLLLSRSLADINRPISASSPPFAVTPGQWQIALGVKSGLKSPDASYSGTVDLQIMDATGKIVGTTHLADVFGQHTWQPIAQSVEVPAGAKTARFVTQINKAEGQLWVDEFSASYLAPAPKKDNRIERIMFDTAQMGNLLFPTDPRTVGVTVQTNKPLSEAQRTLTYEVRDYWGAEQTAPATLTLERKDKRDSKFIYAGRFDLSKAPLEIGRYYEMFASIPRDGQEPYSESTSLAILPVAASKQYKPEEIPFTSRSWDNRIHETIELSDRIGIRIAGTWGGWSEKAPYDAYVPTFDVVKKLGMGWLTGTPAGSIENGETKYDETALRQGVRNLIQKFGDVRPMIISLGNEPHGTGDQVLKNVAAYRAIYEEVKKTDPSITVVATSVEPNEEYFKAGYGKYCDVYDFHIYETSENVRSSIAKYHELMKKYDVVHPIWSTELGLNSQGLARQVVADEVFRKFSAFFASGGERVSWFGMLYPDSNGTLAGTSGEAHNVFYTKYSHYAPKLDAIAYYNAINAITIKKFVGEKQYPNSVHSTFFRDRNGQSLQILWMDKGRADFAMPLSGASDIQTIGIDGRRSTLSAVNKEVTLSVGEDPMLLLYNGGPATLPDTLGTPVITLIDAPATLLRGATGVLNVALNGINPSDVELQAPPFWAVKKSTTAKLVRFEITAPQNSAARMADFTVTAGSGDKKQAELNYRPAVAGQLDFKVLPVAAEGGKPAAVRLLIINNGMQSQTANWNVSLPTEKTMANGEFGSPVAASAYFAETQGGNLTVAGGKTAQVVAPLSGVDAMKIYQVHATVTDATGRASAQDRSVAGFALAPRIKAAPHIDGVLDEAEWQSAPVNTIDQAAQLYKIDKAAPDWKGVDDLSAKFKFLWDDNYLYVGVQVKDDVAVNTKADGSLWAQDGLQFLIDPTRQSAEKVGKYDYSMGLGTKGPQAWSHLSASSLTSTGEAKDILIAAKKGDGGSITYEIAFPWKRLSPFEPRAGNDLGLTLALNEDDGQGRKGFMTWFGNVQSKQVDTVGDVILGN